MKAVVSRHKKTEKQSFVIKNNIKADLDFKYHKAV